MELPEIFGQYPERELATAAVEVDHWINVGLLPADSVFLRIASDVSAQGVNYPVKRIAQELLRFLALRWALQVLKAHTGRE